MKRCAGGPGLIFLSVVLSVFAIRHPAVAASVVDQEQTIIDPAADVLVIGGPTNQMGAQVVTVGRSGFLTEVRFPVGCVAGSNLVVEIRQASIGPPPAPTSIVLTSETISSGLSPFGTGSAVGFRRLRLSTPVPVSAGNVLAIVLSSSGRCSVASGPMGDPYAGGHGFFKSSLTSGAWILLGGRDDLPFQTVVDDIKGKDPLKKSVLDQEQPVIDGDAGGLAIGGMSEQVLAQVVTAGLTGLLAGVGLPVACDTGANLIVEIQGVTGGLPSGAIWTSETIPGTSLPTFFPAAPVFRPLAFSTLVAMTAGTQFAIVLRSPGQCGIFQGPMGDPYPGGEAYFDARPNPPGIWVPLGDFGRHDLAFQTYVEMRPGSGSSVGAP